MLGLRVTAMHKRSNSSFPHNPSVEDGALSSSVDISHRIKQDRGHQKAYSETKKQSLKSKVGNSLRQEILLLDKRLRDQFEVRSALERALGYRSSSNDKTETNSMPKYATELIKEIAVLELEVVHLEQYLLFLYRKAFDQQMLSLSPTTKEERNKSPLDTPKRRLVEVSKPNEMSKMEYAALRSDFQSLDNLRSQSNRVGAGDKLFDSAVRRCHSSLSHHSVFSKRTPAESWGRNLEARHSQPLSMMEFASSNVISLAEHLGTSISDHIPETPNKLSEDMIKCMSSIYRKLADPPLANNGVSSPSSSSSVSGISIHDQYDMWSPRFRHNASFDVQLDNPFQAEGLKEFSGPYSTMIEVQWIYRDGQKFGEIEDLLQNFRSLVHRLKAVDLRKLNHDEKLAFWINVHNTLMMHAYLAYGIPQNNMKKVFILLKAAYNIGGQTITVDAIENCILGCRMSCPGQWIRLLLSSRNKFKSGNERQAYAIDHSEPLLHFALCSGNHSDPAVRMYTPNGVIQEMETAKEEYICATFGVHRNKKILFPKLVESFAKDSRLSPSGVLDMVEQTLPVPLRKSLRKCQLVKSRKCIEWLPHNFTFRYLIPKELVK